MALFCQSDGSPLKFFVETSAVRERPKLVRKIVANGGRIVSSARDADILMAENDTREAIELLDAWSDDKLVLSTRWAWRCIQSNQFFGHEHNWADCMLDRETIKSGLSVDEENSEIEEYVP